ncbi:hypothetical protein NVS55_10630 [Myxococcus stipitatus]|uniref:hypothetical protein n=1 Tax=Myxococcus stipitatus TaxID=83455 RepID=UPI0031454F30
MNARPSRLPRILGLVLALLSTGCPLLGSSVSGDTKTGPDQTTLSPSDPIHRQRVKLFVGPKKRFDQVSVYHASLSIEMRAIRWKPPTGQGAPVLPWFRVRIIDEADGRLVEERTYVFENPRGADTLQFGGSPFYMDVTPEDEPPRFEATYVVEFERQGPPSEGPIDVTWLLGASGMAYGGEHLLVSLSYP